MASVTAASAPHGVNLEAALAHRCPGHSCPYVTKNSQHTYVCQLSGVCFGQASVHVSNKRRLDQNGCVIGRHSSAPERVRRRRSQSGESQAALLAAATLVDEVGYAQCDKEVQLPTTPSPLGPKGLSLLKNGAKSPGLSTSSGSPKEVSPNGRPTVSRQSSKDNPRLKTMEEVASLSKMASDILDSLTGASRRPDLCRLPIAANAASSSAASITSIVTSCSQPETLFQEHGRKFMMRQTLDDHPPDLNNLHDIAINVRTLITRQDERQHAHTLARTQNLHFRRIREAAARVATTLWLVLLGSKYMNTSRRTGDSFRPFASSVFMAMRSGIRLDNGVELVPVCKVIGDALPEVRSQHRERQSHANHLSAHRGACTLHNSLASIPLDEAEEVFAPVIEAAAELRALCPV